MWPKHSNAFITSTQKSAWDSGDSEAIRAADDAALAQAILDSLAELEVSQAVSDPVTEDDLIKAAIEESLSTSSSATHASKRVRYDELQAKKTAEMKNWFDNNGFDIVRNTGGGANNCLLISITQHATGNYDSEHDSEVNAYRKLLMDSDSSIDAYGPLPSSGPAIEGLIDQILKKTGKQLRFAIAGPGTGNEPMFHFYGKGKDYAIIFDQSGHYEAVVPRGSAQNKVRIF
jgi:hypothetical protein